MIESVRRGAAVGKLRGLAADRQRYAFGLAGSRAAGTCAAPTLITALFEPIERHDLRPDDVERLRLVVNPEAQRSHETFSDPGGRSAAAVTS